TTLNQPMSRPPTSCGGVPWKRRAHGRLNDMPRLRPVIEVPGYDPPGHLARALGGRTVAFGRMTAARAEPPVLLSSRGPTLAVIDTPSIPCRRNIVRGDRDLVPTLKCVPRFASGSS